MQSDLAKAKPLIWALGLQGITMQKLAKNLLILFCVSISMVNANEPYYGFYPSDKGPLYKLFRHNIFNFEIDLPQNWIFGIAGKASGQVVMMYPEGLNTAKFSPSYETISVGILPIPDLTLYKAYEYTILGMKQAHKGLSIIQPKKALTLNDNPAINVIYKWPSKTGNTIIENIYFVQAHTKIYSVTTRTIQPIKKGDANIHQGIIDTFNPIRAIEFK